MQDFRRLEVWQKAHRVTLTAYRLTGAFPRDERYGLTSQIRRAAAAVGANIAEGCCRGTDRDFARFIVIALGSASELEYHLILAADLGIANGSDHAALSARVREVKRMLTGLLNRLRADS